MMAVCPMFFLLGSGLVLFRLLPPSSVCLACGDAFSSESLFQFHMSSSFPFCRIRLKPMARDIRMNECGDGNRSESRADPIAQEALLYKKTGLMSSFLENFTGPRPQPID